MLVRAVHQDRGMADALGADTRWVDLCVFSLGTGIAGLAGAALTLIAPVTPTVGQGYIVYAFLVVILGGLGSLAERWRSGDRRNVLGDGTDRHQSKLFRCAVARLRYCLHSIPAARYRIIALEGARRSMKSRAKSCLYPALFVIAACAPFVSTSGYEVTILGRFLAFSILALGISLIWGNGWNPQPRAGFVLRARRLCAGDVSQAFSSGSRPIAGFHGMERRLDVAVVVGAVSHPSVALAAVIIVTGATLSHLRSSCSGVASAARISQSSHRRSSWLPQHSSSASSRTPADSTASRTLATFLDCSSRTRKHSSHSISRRSRFSRSLSTYCATSSNHVLGGCCSRFATVRTACDS